MDAGLDVAADDDGYEGEEDKDTSTPDDRSRKSVNKSSGARKLQKKKKQVLSNDASSSCGVTINSSPSNPSSSSAPVASTVDSNGLMFIDAQTGRSIPMSFTLINGVYHALPVDASNDTAAADLIAASASSSVRQHTSGSYPQHVWPVGVSDSDSD
jgi:hypothetical protein